MEKKHVRILYTSDVHGYLLPVNYATNKPMNSGLSVLASAIETLRHENTLLFDLGDTIQGSPLMYFHQLNEQAYPNPASAMMNHIHYDYFVPGNHDFNYGRTYLESFVHQLDAKPLCANIFLHGNTLFKQGFDIVELPNHIKVLSIGVTTQYIPNWENPLYIKDLVFLDPVIETKKIVQRFKDEVDLIVVGYHGGLEKDLKTKEEFVKDTGENQGFRLFDEIKEIDVLMTGHQHRTICESIDGRVVLQAGCNGAMMGMVDIEFTRQSNGFKKRLTPQLISASDYLPKKEVMEVIQDVEEANQRFLDEVIGVVPKNNLKIKDPIQARIEKHPMIDFINQIQLDASHADLSATSIGNTVTGFDKEITVRNVLSTYIYANTLVIVNIDALTLKTYLEKCAEYFVLKDGKVQANPRFSYPKLEHYNYDMIDGIEYTINLQKPFGDRIESMIYQGKLVEDKDTFTLVLNNYRASGGGDFDMIKELPVIKEIPFNVAELMIEYIRKNRSIDIKSVKNIKLKT